MSDLEQQIKETEQRAADHRRAFERQFTVVEAAVGRRVEEAKKMLAVAGAAWTLITVVRTLMRKKPQRPAPSGPPAKPERTTLVAKLAGLVTLLLPLLRFTPYAHFGTMLRLLGAGRR
jgi:hypothetical protein